MTTQTQSTSQAKSSLLIGSCLVSGTCIGGGMLVMPVQTAESGFFLSLLGILICWAFMTLTGLLLVEATLWVKNETHFSSLSRILIGKEARVLSLLIYLFMNYASLVAYTSGGAALLAQWTKGVLGVELGYEMSCLAFTLIFGSVIYFGSHFVGKLNFFFMVALAMTYFWLVGLGAGHIQADNLFFRPTWTKGMSIFSMILATFSYQMIVPPLCAQLHYDTAKLRRAIFYGTTIPCVVYILWIFVIHGAIPLEGEFGLKQAWIQGASATVPLSSLFPHWSISFFANAFAFFALVTSYFGLSVALFYFLKDCFNELKVSLSRHAIVVCTLGPTLLLAILFPRALLQCLDISGGFGDTLLSGLIPIAMVWIGRYRKKLSGEYQVVGGKPILIAAAAFYLAIFLIQCF